MVAVHRSHSLRSSILSDYWTLTKPEVNFLIAMATMAAFRLGSPISLVHFPWLLLLHTLLGAIFVASGAGTLNQLVARRPIAAARSARVMPRALRVQGEDYDALMM